MEPEQSRSDRSSYKSPFSGSMSQNAKSPKALLTSPTHVILAAISQYPTYLHDVSRDHSTKKIDLRMHPSMHSRAHNTPKIYIYGPQHICVRLYNIA